MELTNVYDRVVLAVVETFNESHVDNAHITSDDVLINKIEDYPNSHFIAQCLVPTRNISMYSVFHDYDACETTVTEYFPVYTKEFTPYPDTHTLDD